MSFRFDTGPCLRHFGSVLAARPVHALQGVSTLEVTLGQASSFSLSARRQGLLLHLSAGVFRHIRELGADVIAERTGLARQLGALPAVHDAMKWAAVSTLPPFREPEARALPCHVAPYGLAELPRVRTTTVGGRPPRPSLAWVFPWSSMIRFRWCHRGWETKLRWGLVVVPVNGTLRVGNLIRPVDAGSLAGLPVDPPLRGLFLRGRTVPLTGCHRLWRWPGQLLPLRRSLRTPP